MVRVLVSVILLIATPGWSAFQCDLGQELGSIKVDQLVSRDSRPFMYAYNARYGQHADAMRAFEAANPKAKTNAYLETPEGKKTNFKLKDIKEGFEFDTAVQYLLGEPVPDRPANDERVDFTHIYRSGKKVFYLDGERLVAIRTQVDKETFVLKIHDSECGLREVVNLDGLKVGEGGNAYRYRLNQAYCGEHRDRVPPEMDQDKMDKMKIYIPEDEADRKSLKKQMDRDCRLWLPPSGGRKSQGQSSSSAK